MAKNTYFRYTCFSWVRLLKTFLNKYWVTIFKTMKKKHLEKINCIRDCMCIIHLILYCNLSHLCNVLFYNLSTSRLSYTRDLFEIDYKKLSHYCTFYEIIKRIKTIFILVNSYKISLLNKANCHNYK